MPNLLRLTRRCVLAAAVTLCFAPAASFAADDAKPAAGKKHVLFLTQSKGFMHGAVRREAPDKLAKSETAAIETGDQSGVFDVEATQDATVITPEKLAKIDVLMFYTTGGLPISDANWQAVQEWISSGKGGFIGVHSATDTQWEYKGKGLDYTHFINGKFNGHPWGQGTPETFVTVEPENPLVKMWGASFEYKEETYQYQMYDPKAVRVLQYMDMERTAKKMPYMVPLTWVRSIGEGRLFYTNLGHTDSTWDDAKFREMLVTGVKFVTGQVDAPTEPNPDVQGVIAIHSLLAHAGSTGFKLPGTPQSIADKLKGADKEWLMTKGDEIAELRYKAFPSEPRKPNPKDEAKDAAKYKKDLENYEKDAAKYAPAMAEYVAKRDKIVDEILKKAGAGTASAK